MEKNRLPSEMNKKNITQSELAKKANISRMTISNIYNQKSEPKASLAIKIARILGTSVEKLFIVIISVIVISIIASYTIHEQNKKPIVYKNNFKWTVSQKDCAKYKIGNNSN